MYSNETEIGLYTTFSTLQWLMKCYAYGLMYAHYRQLHHTTNHGYISFLFHLISRLNYSYIRKKMSVQTSGLANVRFQI